MERRVLSNVWTPSQHITLWLGAWLTGHVGYDHLTEALTGLGAPSPTPGSVELVDAYVPDVINTDQPVGRAELLRLIRACVDDAPWDIEAPPIIRLVLSGAGEPPTLPAGTEVAKAAALSGAAIVISDAEPNWSHVLVPPPLLHDAALPTAASDTLEQPWQWYSVAGPLPEPAHISPGEADRQLAEAARQAAAAIAPLAQNRRVAAPDPRLLVGMLDDHLDLAFLPNDLPRRVATVIARADRVASILTVAQSDSFGAGSAMFDPQLIPLWRTIRQCRMSAVEYAIRYWCET